MARRASEKHGTHQWKVAKEGIYASAFFVFLKRRDAWINNSAFLISTAELLGSKPSLKSAFFKIPKVFRLGALVKSVHLLIKMILNFATPQYFGETECNFFTRYFFLMV